MEIGDICYIFIHRRLLASTGLNLYVGIVVQFYFELTRVYLNYCMGSLEVAWVHLILHGFWVHLKLDGAGIVKESQDDQ